MTAIPLALNRVRAGYGNRIVLDEISLELAAGEWFTLLGPNGSGKSTLLDCIVGRRPLTEGAVFISGHSLQDHPFEAKMRLGYGCSPDELPLLLTARQCLEVHAAAKRLQSISDDLLKLADDLGMTPYWESFVDTLSLGTRQKLAVLLALVGEPGLIVLDEAFNGLDPASSQVLKRHMRLRLTGRGATILLATHSLDIVEHYADRAGLLIDGRLQRIWQAADLAHLRATGKSFDEALAASASISI